MYGSEQRTHIKVGAITIVAVILLLVGITIGRGVNISTSAVQVRIRAASADGLEAGAPVWINGIKQGTVLSVRPDGDSVLIVAGITDDSLLRADARAQVALLEITGGKRLDIVPGTSSAPWNGAILLAESHGDLSKMFSQLGILAQRAGMLFERLDTTIGAANALLSDRNMHDNIRTILSQTSQLVTELRQFTSDNRAALDRIIADVGETSAQLRQAVEHNRPTIERLLERLDRASRDIETLAQRATQVASTADSTLSQLNAMLHDLRSQRTVLGRLLYDEQLASSLDSTIHRLGGLVDTISRYGINVNVRLGTRP